MSSSGSQTSWPAAAEAERLEAHRLQGDVAGEDHQVGPRDLPAVLLLDRPEQAAGLVEVRVVGPAVERGEALRAGAGAAAAVVDAVGAGAVPRHADEERAVVAVVGRPPVLRRRSSPRRGRPSPRRGRGSRTRRRSRTSSPIGSISGEFWLSSRRFSWFGHQCWFAIEPVARVGVAQHRTLGRGRVLPRRWWRRRRSSSLLMGAPRLLVVAGGVVRDVTAVGGRRPGSRGRRPSR